MRKNILLIVIFIIFSTFMTVVVESHCPSSVQKLCSYLVQELNDFSDLEPILRVIHLEKGKNYLMAAETYPQPDKEISISLKKGQIIFKKERGAKPQFCFSPTRSGAYAFWINPEQNKIYINYCIVEIKDCQNS